MEHEWCTEAVNFKLFVLPKDKRGGKKNQNSFFLKI